MRLKIIGNVHQCQTFSIYLLHCRVVPHRKLLRSQGKKSLIIYFFHHVCRSVSCEGTLVVEKMQSCFAESKLIFKELILDKCVQLIQKSFFIDFKAKPKFIWPIIEHISVVAFFENWRCLA